MKDVSDILAKRLKMLENRFSRDWLSDFSFFMEFVQTNSLTSRIISSFTEEKEKAHASIIKQLIYSGTYSESPVFSHTLGELEIKKELKKVFFPHNQFAGPLVQINEIAGPINVTEILENLSVIKKEKKHNPSFNHWDYLKYSNTP